MKILYISYDGMTDPLGQSQVIPYLIGLSKNHQITLISCEKEERYELQKNTIQKLLSANRINWLPVSYSRLPSILSKQWNIARIKWKAIHACKQEQIDIVHCRSYMAALIGLFLKKKFGVKFIFDMRGFWADERIDGNIWSKNRYIHKQLYAYFKKKEIEFLCNADYTVSLTENAKREILSWSALKSCNVPIEVIPCCADLHHFSLEQIQPLEQRTLREKLSIAENDLIISYLGSIGTWYMLDEMLDFFSCVLEKIPNAKFLFITPDKKEDILEKARMKRMDTKQLIICSANRKDVPLYLSLSSLAVYFIKPCYSKKASSPTKTAEILGLGIPIITNTGIGDSNEIIETSGAGLLIHEFNKENYMNIIQKFSVLLSIDKRKLVETSHAYFSLEKGVKLYESVYNRINTKN